MTTSVATFLSHDFSERPSAGHVFHEFLACMSWVILDLCNIKVFVMAGITLKTSGVMR